MIHVSTIFCHYNALNTAIRNHKYTLTVQEILSLGPQVPVGCGQLGQMFLNGDLKNTEEAEGTGINCCKE